MYSKLQSLWEEVKPLYTKLHGFVKKRLFNHYKLEDNNGTEIPVYLLGSDFGEDWSDIAEFIVPHAQLYHDVVTEIQHKTIKRIYKLAENMTKSVGLSGLGKGFWRNSTFNSTNCNTVLFVYCSEQFTEISTCSNISWKSYLKAHEVAMEIALNNMDYDSLPRRNLRYSAADEALIGLSSILAVNNLPLYGILEPDALKVKDENYNQRMTALLLTALQVLPRLAYYVAAEKWRTELIQNQNGLVNLGEEWWKKRKEIQGVVGVTNAENDYLRDLYITKNQPYLSKILGIFLQFQLYDYYYKSQIDPEQNLATSIGEDMNFRLFVKERPTRDWLSLVTYYFEISEISSASLLEYFQPLEQYLDNAPEKQEPFTRKPPKKVELTDEDYSETTTRKSKKNKKKEQLKTSSPLPAFEDDLTNYGIATDEDKEKEERKSVSKQKKASKEGSERVSITDEGDVQNDQGKKDGSDGESSDPESKQIQSQGTKYTTDMSQTIGTYIGIVVIVCSVVTISAVLIRQKIRRKRHTNNRRFET
ncbi:angiotensin-converting enzyme-related protein [Agrilus planipennis]|uniref:Angiotensin-converting enzyme n=1 Tax=Agrilus planipennis TaxID=224129 RepID=A0A1W4XIX4_AGRPL|nr:angiotensin-converting enzyme-related protein [Agrilus planipennis]